MAYEHEITILNVERSKVLSRLKELGARHVGNVAIHDVYKRYGLDFLDVMRGNSAKLERLLKDR